MTTLNTSYSSLALHGMLVAKQKCQGARLAFAMATVERPVADSTLPAETQARERVVRGEAAEIMWRQACRAPQLRLGSRLSTPDVPILVQGAQVSEGMDAEIWVIDVFQEAAAEADISAADVVDVVDVVDVIDLIIL